MRLLLLKQAMWSFDLFYQLQNAASVIQVQINCFITFLLYQPTAFKIRLLIIHCMFIILLKNNN